MEALIPIQKSKGGRDVVSARTLHQFLEVGTRFDMWWARRLAEYAFFTKGTDYHGPILCEGQVEDYVITLDMAKELSMVERNEKGAAARRYFIECERVLRTVTTPALPDFSNPVAAARAWADAEEGRLLAEAQARDVAAQLQVAAPKIALAEAVAVSTNALSFAQAAKLLKIAALAGRNRLVARLKADQILKGNREPYQKYVEAGYFEVQGQPYQPGTAAEKGTKGTRVGLTTRVTPKGLAWLLNRYRPTPTLPVTA